MACPFSLRPAPQDLGDFTFDNNFAIVSMKLRLVDNLTSGISLINRDMMALKNSMEPIGLSYLIKVAMLLPEFLRSFIFEDFSDKMTFGFSNVPGPKQPFVTCGSRGQGMGFVMPVGKTIVGSFSIISHADVVKIAITMDKAVMVSTEDITGYLMQNLDEILGGDEWRQYG